MATEAADATRHRLASEIFLAAIELPPTQRHAFIADRCRDEAALRDIVERLLAADEAAPDFMSVPAAADRPGVEAPAVPPGGRIGHWEILEELGSGGMGTVFRARRVEADFEQEVALKLVHGRLASGAAQRRFRQERQILSGLEHPGIARLLDGGTTRHGEAYLVMERIEGRAFNLWYTESDLPIADRLSLFVRVCDAVAYAHRSLVVHLDIKPANILVTAAGDPKLLDFGIARLVESEDGLAVATSTLSSAMTPDYASPEQVRGDPVSTASDIYSLGVLLYELLTMEKPYRTVGLSPSAVERRVAHDDPELPSARLRRTHPADAKRLGGDLDTIVAKAMAKEPAHRYPSVQSLAEDLRRYLEGRPVSARRPTRTYLASRFARRHRLPLVAAGTVLLALIAGLVTTTWQARVASLARDRAALEAQRSERIVEFLREMLTAADPGSGDKDVTVAEVLDSASRRADMELKDLPAVEGAVRSTLAATYRGLGRLDAAENEARRAAELAAATVGGSPTELAQSHHTLGIVLSDSGQFEEGEQVLRQAISELRALSDGETDLAAALNSLGLLLKRAGREAEAEPLYQESLALYDSAGLERDPRVAEVMNNLAVLLGGRGDMEAAEPLHREAYEILSSTLGDRAPRTLSALFSLANVIDLQGRRREAESLYRETLRGSKEVLGEVHPDTLIAAVGLAYNLRLQGRPDEAVPVAEQAVRAASENLPAGHLLTAYAELTLGNALCEAGKAREGVTRVRSALAARERALPPDHWLLASTRLSVASCLLDLRDYSTTESLLLAAYQTLASDRGPDHERTLAARALLARLYRELGNPAEARRWGG